MKRAESREEAGLFLKFGLVGAGGFLVDAAVLQIGLALGLTPEPARALSILVAIQATFAANDALVFRAHRTLPLARRWLGYLAANAVGALFSYVLFLALLAADLPVLSTPLGALAAASVASWAVNYTGSRLLSYRDRRRPAA